jgi:hypothetical protein
MGKILIIAALLIGICANAQDKQVTTTEVSGSVKETVTADDFQIYPISDALFERMYGRSYKENCTIPRDSLRYVTVLHYDGDGQVVKGELVCHESIAADLLEIFREMYEIAYPIERMTLIDDYDASDEASMAVNNTSCFNFRVVAGSTKLSKHAEGKAIDVNPFYNPYVKNRGKGKGVYVSPEAARQYANRSKQFKYKIDEQDPLYKAFVRHGFKWGGSWKTLKDYQHFEK